MSEIKVVPYIPDEDYDNPAMVVDFYEFTMANCLFLNGFKDTTLVFDMFFRKNPDNQGYSISAGQRKLTRFLLNYHFNEQDVHWLRTKGMSEEFCEYLRTYRWKGDMYALPEGTVCYPHVQMVRIECDLVGVSASAWKMENPWWKNSLKEDELFYIMGKEFIDNCETHESVD